MEIFGNDLIIGNWRASNFGLVIGSFDDGGNTDIEVGMSPQTTEEYLGDNPVPIYVGQTYNNKLTPSVTLIKNPCDGETYFNEYDIRSVLRPLTGVHGYQWMTLVSDNMEEDIQYRVRITNVTYKQASGKVIGITLDMETDSIFAWSREKDIKLSVSANKEFNVYNHSDDLNNYILPTTIITCSNAGIITLTNETDNNYQTQARNVIKDEILTIDSEHEIVRSSASHDPILNDFNLHFVRMISGQNTYTCSMDADIEFKFREPRKIGFV